MGLLDNIFGSDSNTEAVPGGNLSKPLMVALLALLASRYFGQGGQSKEEQATPPSKAPEVSADDPAPGNVLDGLGGLLRQFQQHGQGNVIDSWVGTGANKDISPRQISEALDPDLINEISRQTGLSREQVLAGLSQALPRAVDKLTPEGRLPTRQEIARLSAA
jgi:uncharacterized protein YidB (DUF937 family)